MQRSFSGFSCVLQELSCGGYEGKVTNCAFDPTYRWLASTVGLLRIPDAVMADTHLTEKTNWAAGMALTADAFLPFSVRAATGT